MPKVILRRYWRKPGGRLLATGTLVDVSEDEKEFLLTNGAAIDPDATAEDGRDDGEDAGEDAGSGKDENTDPEGGEPTDDATVDEDVAGTAPTDADVEVTKPRKTDKLSVWQEYADAIKHPYKGKTLEQLKAEIG